MRELLAALGDPQAGLPAIHVVGTNGKSTTTRMIEELLLAHGPARRRVRLAARPLVERARPGQRRRGRARRAARASSGPAAERLGATQFEVAHRGRLRRLSRREHRGGRDRGRARRPPRRDERPRRRAGRRAHERLARPHRGPRRDARGDRRREARRRPAGLHRRPRRAGVGGGGARGGCRERCVVARGSAARPRGRGGARRSSARRSTVASLAGVDAPGPPRAPTGRDPRRRAQSRTVSAGSSTICRPATTRSCASILADKDVDEMLERARDRRGRGSSRARRRIRAPSPPTSSRPGPRAHFDARRDRARAARGARARRTRSGSRCS